MNVQANTLKVASFVSDGLDLDQDVNAFIQSLPPATIVVSAVVSPYVEVISTVADLAIFQSNYAYDDVPSLMTAVTSDLSSLTGITHYTLSIVDNGETEASTLRKLAYAIVATHGSIPPVTKYLIVVSYLIVNQPASIPVHITG